MELDILTTKKTSHPLSPETTLFYYVQLALERSALCVNGFVLLIQVVVSVLVHTSSSCLAYVPLSVNKV